VLTKEFVCDKSMLKDPEKEGMTQYGTIAATKPDIKDRQL
jgi:hypothetical protein